MFDLHTHTILSDGELLPIELIRRVSVLGVTTLGITDHADVSNYRELIETVGRLERSAEYYGVELLVGVELTHVPPEEIAFYAEAAKDEGARVVVVHGETTTEPVAPGTNAAACRCSAVDILAHPGFVTKDDAEAAALFGVSLEITARCGHNRTNGHVVKAAQKAGTRLVVNSDAHAPRDLISYDIGMIIARGAGLSEEESASILSDDNMLAITRG